MPKTAVRTLFLLIALLPVHVHAQTSPDSVAVPDSVVAAAVSPAPSVPPTSYWGSASAAPGDSTLVRFSNPPRPLWESVIYWPVRIASYPLALTARGVGEGVEALDDGKVLYRIGRLLAPRRGPFGVLLDFRAGGVSGFGGGFTAEHGAFFGEGNLFRLRAETTTRGEHRLNLGVRVPAGVDVMELALGYRVRPYARYFGLGPETSDDGESFYRQETAWVGASRRWGLGGGVHLQGDFLYSSISTREPGRDEGPSIESEYAGALPVGYGFHHYGWTVGGQASHENGLGPGRATHGGLRRIRLSRFLGATTGDDGFWTFRGEAQQYLPLFFPYRVLALRGFASWIEASDGGRDVGFQRLLTNDDPDLLRGYEDFRFRDLGMAVLSAEYRWPLWTNKTPDGSGVDLYLLGDAGQVFHDTDDLGGDNLTYSYGGGLRLESSSAFRARLEFAWSEEQMVFRLRADQIFQFMKGSLFFGRDPVPDR